MTVGEQLDLLGDTLRELAKQSIERRDDDCCGIALLQAAETVCLARNKLSEYGVDGEDAP